MALIFILTLGALNTAFSQDNTFNLKIDKNGQVIWQKIFDTDLNFSELINKVKMSGNVLNIENTENSIFGEMRRLECDYIGAGYKRAGVAISILANDLIGYVNIDFKEGKYRVTLKNLKYIHKMNTPVGRQDQITDFDSTVLKNGKFRKRLNSNHQAEIIDYTFTKAFSFEKEETNEW